MRFCSSKGDQLPRGAVLTRVRDVVLPARYALGGCCGFNGSVGVSVCVISSKAPFAAFSTEGGCWLVWTQSVATAVLCDVVALAGLAEAEYALHSLRIGGATFLSAYGGVEKGCLFNRRGEVRCD